MGCPVLGIENMMTPLLHGDPLQRSTINLLNVYVCGAHLMQEGGAGARTGPITDVGFLADYNKQIWRFWSTSTIEVQLFVNALQC